MIEKKDWHGARTKRIWPTVVSLIATISLAGGTGFFVMLYYQTVTRGFA